LTEEEVKIMAECFNCLYQILPILIGLLVVASIYLYKKKCEKNIFELILDALKGNNRTQNSGVLIFMVLLIAASSDEFYFKIIGMVGSLILIAIFLFMKDPIDDLSNQIDDQTQSANTAEQLSVLNTNP